MELVIHSNRIHKEIDVFEILYQIDQAIRKYVGLIGYYLLLPLIFLISYPIIVFLYRKIIKEMKDYKVSVTSDNLEVSFDDLHHLERFQETTSKMHLIGSTQLVYKPILAIINKARIETSRVIKELREQLYPFKLTPEQTEILRTELGDCSDWDAPEMDAYDYHYHPLKQNECTNPAM